MQSEVVRYSKPVRILHWTYAGIFLILFFTGLVLFIPALGPLGGGGWTRMLHRAAAVLFVAVPLAYLTVFPRAAWQGIKEALKWSQKDLAWVKAMPRYYFLLDEKAMPPQDHMNTGQKLWWLMVIVSGLMFTVTGSLIIFSKITSAKTLFEWSVMLHDATFVATGCMLFVHVYLSVLHPLMRPLRYGPWNGMTRGTVSVEHARTHHGKWYEGIARKSAAVRSITMEAEVDADPSSKEPT